MVSQGRIGAISNAKPIDRRSLLEEAAGITGLHSRRHEAELRLKAAEANLSRLDDVIVTLESQLAALKKQARQATRYRNLQDHIRRAEATLSHLHWLDATSRKEHADSALQNAEAAVTAFTWRDLATREPEQVRGSKRFWRMASGVNTLGTLLYFAAGRRKNAAPKG